MPPQQAPIAPSFGAPNQYDFIVNSNHHRRPNDWLVQASFRTRVMVVVGGFFALLILIWIFLAILSSGSNGSIQNFTALTQEQTELARISNSPSRTADSDTAQNLASTAQTTLLSDESTFAAYLSGLNARPTYDVLTRTRNRETDAELAAARTNGTYDQTYIDLATSQLTTYLANLKHAYNATGNRTERALLSQAYQNAQLLLDLAQSKS